MAGDAAQNAANKVRPGEDRLATIDHPAEDNTWHDVPDLSRDALRNQAKSAYEKNSPLKKQDLDRAAGDATASAHPSGSRDPADAADLAAHEQQTGQPQGIDAQAGVSSAKDNLVGTASQNIPDERKDQAKDYRNRTKGYLTDKMPQERRDQTIWRLKKMIVEIQGHSDCRCIARNVYQ